MLTDTLYRVRRIEGLQQLQRRGDGGARELTSSRLRLAAGATYKYQIAAEETVLVLQEGKGTFVTPVVAGGTYAAPAATVTATAETPLGANAASTPAPAGGNAPGTGPEGIEGKARRE